MQLFILYFILEKHKISLESILSLVLESKIKHAIWLIIRLEKQTAHSIGEHYEIILMHSGIWAILNITFSSLNC